jgi:hypothetical protein
MAFGPALLSVFLASYLCKGKDFLILKANSSQVPSYRLQKKKKKRGD